MLRTSLLLATALLLTLALSAQDRKGSFYLGGGTSATYQSINGSSTTGVTGVAIDRPGDLTGLRATSFRSGYFLTNRLLVGSRIDYLNASVDQGYLFDLFEGGNRLVLKPFVRYYLLDGKAEAKRPLAVFGELGFGTIGFGRGEAFETDFHLGLGAEVNLAAGVVGTAGLYYNANALGLNYTNLNVGLNLLTGQLALGAPASWLRAGTWTTNGQWLNLAYGHTRRGERTDSDLQLQLSPRLGYFVLDGLLLESTLDLSYARRDNNIGIDLRFPGGGTGTDLRVDVGLRYYVLPVGNLRPFATAGFGYRNVDQDQLLASMTVNRSLRYRHWRAGAGAFYLLNNAVAIDLSTGYQQDKPRRVEGGPFGGQSSTENQNRWQTEVGLRFFLVRR